MRHVQHRAFFHAPVDAEIGASYRRVEETPDGGAEPILFDFFWRPLEESIPLFADLDAFLPELCALIHLAQRAD